MRVARARESGRRGGCHLPGTAQRSRQALELLKRCDFGFEFCDGAGCGRLIDNLILQALNLVLGSFFKVIFIPCRQRDCLG